MTVVILLADGLRPDVLARALGAGHLPALDRLRIEGGLHTVTSVFPSVTGPAYAPFLLGRYPGGVGLPGIRWFDRRARSAARARSYVGPQMRLIDRDLDPGAPTLFELAPPALGALAMINRGLPRASRLGVGLRFAARAARTHVAGDVRGWLAIDREIAHEAARRIRNERPRIAFVAFTGGDKTSHAVGQDDPRMLQALRIVDEVAGRIRRDAETDGREVRIWIASDHGHSTVSAHDDLAAELRALGYRVLAHPWVYRRRADVAVMVSGNAMAHLYVELERRDRPWWPKLRARWESLADALLERPSVDLVLLPHSPTRCEVRARNRGSALIERVGSRIAHRPVTGDPLGLGELAPLDPADAHGATATCDYPDALVQIAALAGAPRSGDLLLSAMRGWDFRARWEPIPHRSAHGALHREHMLVPLLLDRSVQHAPRRTADVMPSVLQVLGLALPDGLDGSSFL